MHSWGERRASREIDEYYSHMILLFIHPSTFLLTWYLLYTLYIYSPYIYQKTYPADN